jgi:hypothetical protein
MQPIARWSAAPRERMWFAAVLLVALALRVWDLGARSLWFDEAGEYWVATAPLSHLLHFVSVGSGDPPLYSFLLHGWMKLGHAEAWLRLLSVFASVSGVAGIIVLARRLGGFPAAFVAGSLVAVNPPDIRYAQEAGQYALMLGTIAWNLVALHSLWNDAGRKSIVSWAATAFLATTAYYGSVFPVLVPFGCALVEALARRDRARVRAFGLALVLFLVIAVPVLWSVLPDQMARVLDTRTAQSNDPRAVAGIALVYRWICNLFAFHFAGWPYTHVPAWLPVVCWFALLSLALRVRPRWALWLVATWAAYGIASLLQIFPFGFRWGLPLLPLVLVVAAVGATVGMRDRIPKLIGTMAFLGLLGSGIASLPNRSFRDAIDPQHAMPWPETEELRDVVDYWHQRRTPDQPTYVFYGAAPAFAYYLQRYPDTRDPLPPAWSLSCWSEDNPPDFCRRGNIYYGRWLRSLGSPEAKVRSISETLGGRPREFWIVFSHVQFGENVQIVDRLARNGFSTVDSIERASTGAVLLRSE